MLSTGVTSQVDPTVYYWLDEHFNVTGVLTCHVDDFLWAGSQHISTNVIPLFKSAFNVGHEEHENIYYGGQDIITGNSAVQVNQHSSTDNLQPLHVQTGRAKRREAQNNFEEPSRSSTLVLVGSESLEKLILLQRSKGHSFSWGITLPV